MCCNLGDVVCKMFCQSNLLLHSFALEIADAFCFRCNYIDLIGYCNEDLGGWSSPKNIQVFSNKIQFYFSYLDSISYILTRATQYI